MDVQSHLLINTLTLIHYNLPTSATAAPTTVPQPHTLPTPLPTAALPVKAVPLKPGTPVDVLPLPVVEVPNPPIVAITPANPLVVVLPRKALKGCVVLPPTTTDDPSLWRDTTVPETVIGDPPALSVSEPDAAMYSGVAVGAGIAMTCVTDPIAMVAPFEASETGVPDNVTWPPGVKVDEPMTKPDAEFAVIVELPIVTTTKG